MRRLLIAVLLLLPLAAIADNLRISPVRIETRGTPVPEVIHLTNGGGTDLRYTVQVSAWSQDATGDHFTPAPADILVSPPLLDVPAHSERVIRVLLMRPVGTGAYYKILIHPLQTTDATVEGKGGTSAVIHFVVNQELPVAFEPAQAAPADVTAHAVDGHLVLRDAGGLHAEVYGIGEKTGALGWVLPGGSKPFPRVHAVAGQTITVDLDGKPVTLTVQ